MSDRNILQTKATLTYQVFCRAKPKCVADTDLDSTHYYFIVPIPAKESHTNGACPTWSLFFGLTYL